MGSKSLRLLTTPLLIAALAGCPSPLSTLPPPGEVVGEHWLRFVHISDTQLADEESPARAVRLDPLISAAWRPQEAYGVATLDATLQAINAIHDEGKLEGRPVSCVVITGDLVDSAQYNEVRWFLDTMDGLSVDTDSGVVDATGRTADDGDNPKLPYAAAGLSREIPWYSIVGNHDVLATGNFPIDASSNSPALYSAPLLRPVAAAIGLHQIDRKLNAFFPVLGQSPAVISGLGPVGDPETLQISVGDLRAGKLPPDAARRYLTRREYIEEHFNTLSGPPGHGFTEENLVEGHGFFTFRPDPAVPIRFVALDTVPPRIPKGYPAFYGVMTREQFDYQLCPAIEEARAAGEFVILLSHHPADDFDLPYPARKIGARAFREYLAQQPNVVAHLAGHTHFNRIGKVDGLYPYYEVVTGAIIDYPQEGRVLDVYYDAATETLTLAGTMFSHLDVPARLAAESFRRARIDAEQGQGYEIPDDKAYQMLFEDAAKAWGVGHEVPREKTRYSPAERSGGASDRNVVLQVHRPAPESW